jgi:hypothetical protein
MAQGPIQDSSVDTKALYDRLNRLEVEITEARALAEQGGAGSDDESPVQEPTPCNPFVVARRVKKRGERVTMCFQFPPGEDVRELKATVWRKNKAKTAYVERYTHTFKEITDENRLVGGFSGEFEKSLPFTREYTLTRIRVTDSRGRFHWYPATDPSPSHPPPITYGTIDFTTGNPSLTGPATHNFFRNGRLERSKYAWRMLTAPTPDDRQLECHGWFIGCDRNRPIVASGHPNFTADLQWLKADGTFLWRGGGLSISQRLPQRPLRASEVIYALFWASQSSFVAGLIADLHISICSVVDTRSSSGSLLVTKLATAIVYGFGQGANSPIPTTPLPLSAAPDPVPVDTGGGTVIPVNAPSPVQRSLIMPSTYSLTQTPRAVSGRTPPDSSGQWIMFELFNIQNPNNIWFKLDRFRAGYGDGDYVPHAKELGVGDEDDDQIGEPDVATNRSGAGYQYGHSANGMDFDRGGILRPNPID